MIAISSPISQDYPSRDAGGSDWPAAGFGLIGAGRNAPGGRAFSPVEGLAADAALNPMAAPAGAFCRSGPSG